MRTCACATSGPCRLIRLSDRSFIALQELADFKTEFSNLNARLVEAQELLSLRERDLLDTRDQLNQLAMVSVVS